MERFFCIAADPAAESAAAHWCAKQGFALIPHNVRVEAQTDGVLIALDRLSPDRVARALQTVPQSATSAITLGLSLGQTAFDPAMIARFDALADLNDPPSLIRARLQAARRRRALDAEIAARAQSFLRFGTTFHQPDIQQNPSTALFFGPPSPEFLRASHRLQSFGVQITAALTAGNAMDLLHGQHFDAIAIGLGPEPQGALQFIAQVRRNRAAFDIPIVAIDVERSDLLQEALARGVNDALVTRDPATIARLMAAVERYRHTKSRRRALAQNRPAAVMDLASGAFSRDFARAHLDALLRQGMPVHVLIVQFSAENDPNGACVDYALPQIASIAHQLVRAEDLLFRAGRDAFGVVTSSGPAAVTEIEERMLGIVSVTAFDRPDGARAGQIFARTLSLSAADLDSLMIQVTEWLRPAIF
ncbi:MAG TPA: hypothetical protein DCZ49_02705 [Hyphomonadaceae bacterium]|nr:hypothetical protein [Hyphomonadaceae bacterium]